jgi:hypothetical protein
MAIYVTNFPHAKSHPEGWPASTLYSIVKEQLHFLDVALFDHWAFAR